MSDKLPPFDHDECPPTHCENSESDLLKAHISTLEKQVAELTRENSTLRECNAQLVASEQSIRNQANKLRAQVRELEGRIANALL